MCLAVLSLVTLRAHALPSQLFPGLIYRMVKPKVVLLIFVSGKIVLTGAKVRCTRLDLFFDSEQVRTDTLVIIAVPRGDLPGLCADLPGPE